MRKLKKKTFKYLLSKPQIWKSNVVISRTDYVEQKCESHGQHAYYSSFNQSYIFIFVTLSQLLPSLFFCIALMTSFRLLLSKEGQSEHTMFLTCVITAHDFDFIFGRKKATHHFIWQPKQGTQKL